MAMPSRVVGASVLLAVLGTGLLLQQHGPREPGRAEAATRQLKPVQGQSEDQARQAFDTQAHGKLVLVHGIVERVLADDRDGSPHQRFIIRSPRGVGVLVAHNLDLAPRLDGLAAGDAVTILGEYEWNEKGGLMHWTHKDPQGKHQSGYIEWRGRRYQ